VAMGIKERNRHLYEIAVPSVLHALFLYKGNFAHAHTGPRHTLLLFAVLVGSFKHYWPRVSIHLFPPKFTVL